MTKLNSSEFARKVISESIHRSNSQQVAAQRAASYDDDEESQIYLSEEQNRTISNYSRILESLELLQEADLIENVENVEDGVVYPFKVKPGIVDRPDKQGVHISAV